MTIDARIQDLQGPFPGDQTQHADARRSLESVTAVLYRVGQDEMEAPAVIK